MFEQEDANVKVYQYDAFADRIVSTHKDYENWLDSNYIQQYGWMCEDAPLEFNRYTIDYIAPNIFGYHPLINYDDFRGGLGGENKKNVISVIQDNQIPGCYWYLNLDLFYLNGEADYQKNHFKHDVLVVKDTGTSFLYVQYLGGRYSINEAKYQDFYDAFCAHDDSCCYRLSAKTDVSYEFDIERFKKMLKAYINSENGFDNKEMYYKMDTFNNPDFYDMRFGNPKVWGIDVYDLFEECMSKCLEEHKMIDYRLPYSFYEHKAGMGRKLERCYRDGYIDTDSFNYITQEINSLKEAFYSLLLIIMKYNVSLNGKQVEKYLKMLPEMKDKERKLFQRFYDSLR